MAGKGRRNFFSPRLFSAESKGFCVPGAPISVQQWWRLTWPGHKWTAASFSRLEWQAKQAPQAWCSCSSHTLSSELLNLSLAGISSFVGSFFAHFPSPGRPLRVMVASRICLFCYTLEISFTSFTQYS